MNDHRFFLLFGLLYLIFIGGSASLSKDLLGIAPSDVKYFKSEIIKCKDGSKKFSKAQLNDDFCDCPDGTDEPGTSACPGGKFYCQNAGHAPLLLFSSRVNDGICDCCDGSDEYNGKVKCPNTCWEAGKVARDKLKKKIATYQEGITIRKQEVEKVKQALAKDEAELSKLKNEEKILKGLVQQLKERKEQIEKEEEKERLQKEKEEKMKKEAEENDNVEKGEANKADEKEKEVMGTPHDDKIGLLKDPPSDQDLVEDDDGTAEVQNSDDSGKKDPPNHRVNQHTEDKETVVASESHDAGSNASPDQGVEKVNDGSENTEGLSREELGRLVASRWTGETTGQKTEEADAEKVDGHEGHEETPDSSHDEDYDGYASENDEETEKYDDDGDMEEHVSEDFGEDHGNSGDSYEADSEDQTDFSDIATSDNPSWLDKIQQTVRNVLQAVNLFKTPVDKSDAARVRKEYDDSSKKLSKMQSRISSLTKKLKHDFGPEKEFYSFYDRCFEHKQNKYVYKVCPFKQASQVEGHSTTQLGHWEKFEDSYRVMLFSNGDKCWNGPDRSLKVRLRCGLNDDLTDVDEPSRCEYVALLSTPALCVEEKLKELQHKLDLMNAEQPQSHDEL